MEIADIKNALIETCLKGDAELFINFLNSDLVETNMPNKMRFYRFFKRMIANSQKNTIGALTLKIDKADWLKEKDSELYTFYDQLHKYPRLTLIIRERENRIYIETSPF